MANFTSNSKIRRKQTQIIMDKYLPIKELSPSGYALTVKALTEELLDGSYELDNGAYAFISSYVTKDIKEGLYEAHKAYTDVQIILHGQEIIGVMTLEEMLKGECVKPYEYDIELYKSEGGELHLLEVGDYLILTPNDAHMPGVNRKATQMRKLVLKIPYDK